MNKSQRIYLSSGDTGNDNQDKYISVKLEQDVETLEFMSLSLGTADVYQNFNADYGVLVGRVLANGGIGIPNAKISIFIPITDEDTQNKDIYSFYPYKTPRDKNNDGKRYNLLPRVSQINPETQQPEPKQAFGSFPIKEEIVGNLPFLDVYKKYYKYTALTNIAGDYMIFGVPIGTQTVHLSCDITDIGEYSMNPASMIVNLGYSESQFIDNGTRIKPSNDLGDLPHIETQEITVDIRPFWGDAENFEIGIVRQDFRLRAILTNTFTIFGSAFTDGSEVMRGAENDGGGKNEKEIRDMYAPHPTSYADTGVNNWQGMVLATKRIGKIKETIYYYPSEVSDDDINNGTADPQDDMRVLDPTEYSVYTRNGDFVFIVNCNRRRVVTDEYGNEVVVDYDNPNGVFTEFRGFVTLEYSEDELPMVGSTSIEEEQYEYRTRPTRLRYKFPQHAGANQSFIHESNSNADTYNNAWRKQHMKFEASKFYGFAKFHGLVHNDENTDNNQANDSGFLNYDTINRLYKSDDNNVWDNKQNIGTILLTNTYGPYNNSQFEMEHNLDNGNKWFGSNWLNLSIYFPQTGYIVNTTTKIKKIRTATFLSRQYINSDNNGHFIVDNDMKLAASRINTKWYGRSDLHWTDIIEIPLADIRNFSAMDKGFKDNAVSAGLVGEYRNGNNTPDPTEWKGTWGTACPYNGGKSSGNPSNSPDQRTYFFKGFDTSDCIEFLYELGLVV